MSRQTLLTRLHYSGGNQLARINQQKLKSLQQALKNDYNSREIIVPNGKHYYALINKNNLKADYDKEYISVEFESGLEAGDVFQIADDKSHWMVYLPIITETAYLRAEIIKCRYQLELEGEKYWIYFQGPTETDLRWFIKNGVNINELNLSGTIYIKNTPFTKQYFKRFTKLELDGHKWEVQVTDSITVPGIIELEVQEYYDNSIEELPKVIAETQDTEQTPIIGASKVLMNSTNGYMVNPIYYDPKIEWEIADNPRVRVHEVLQDGRICTVLLLPGASKSFNLKYGDFLYHVEIEDDIHKIQGPQEVYPYETHTYWTNDPCEFAINKPELVEIVSTTESSCEIKILTGKKGQFKVGCMSSSGQVLDTLEVTIKSF